MRARVRTHVCTRWLECFPRASPDSNDAADVLPTAPAMLWRVARWPHDTLTKMEGVYRRRFSNRGDCAPHFQQIACRSCHCTVVRARRQSTDAHRNIDGALGARSMQTETRANAFVDTCRSDVGRGPRNLPRCDEGAQMPPPASLGASLGSGSTGRPGPIDRPQVRSEGSPDEFQHPQLWCWIATFRCQRPRLQIDRRSISDRPQYDLRSNPDPPQLGP